LATSHDDAWEGTGALGYPSSIVNAPAATAGRRPRSSRFKLVVDAAASALLSTSVAASRLGWTSLESIAINADAWPYAGVVDVSDRPLGVRVEYPERDYRSGRYED
jgi:hypothetical protein